MRDYSGDFLSKIEASLTAKSLCGLAKERTICVAVDGEAIIGTVESEARARGECLLTLYASLSAVPFYETTGWGTIREHHDSDARLVVMTKRLPAGPRVLPSG